MYMNAQKGCLLFNCWPDNRMEVKVKLFALYSFYFVPNLNIENTLTVQILEQIQSVKRKLLTFLCFLTGTAN